MFELVVIVLVVGLLLLYFWPRNKDPNDSNHLGMGDDF